MADFYGRVLSSAREPLAAMSEAALQAFDRLSGLSTVNVQMDTSGLQATSASLERARQALDDMQAAASSVGMSGFGKWMVNLQLQSQRVQVEFLGQKASLQALMEGYDNGTANLQDFIAAARQARSSLNLLNDSDLRSLESAIAGAEQRLKSLNDSARSTLENLQSQLDQLQGNQDALDARRFAQQRRDIEAQLAEARAAGDQQAAGELSKALGVLRQVQDETDRQRLAQAQQARQTATPAAQPAAQPAAPTTVIRLESAARGARVDVSVPQGQQTQLLDILAEAGLRTV